MVIQTFQIILEKINIKSKESYIFVKNTIFSTKKIIKVAVFNFLGSIINLNHRLKTNFHRLF
jgi:hypothetical protein